MQPLELQKVILPFRKKPTKFLLVPQVTRAWEDIEGILCLLKVFLLFLKSYQIQISPKIPKTGNFHQQWGEDMFSTNFQY